MCNVNEMDLNMLSVAGMAKFLADGRADLVSGFYTVNLQRFQVVDFTFPAMDDNYAFVIKSKHFG